MDKDRSDAAPESGDIEAAADRREQAADVREGDLDAREFRVMVREDADSERANQVEKIKTAADKRDEQAEARDMVSSKRDMAANLDAWMHMTDDDEGHEARQLAYGDRAHSRRDRIASADDRDHLADNGTHLRPELGDQAPDSTVPDEERDVVAQATGVLVAQFGLSTEDALEKLTAKAADHARPIADIAREIVKHSGL